MATPQITGTKIVKRDGEWIVLAFVGSERYSPGDYFASDAKDAEETAKRMKEQRRQVHLYGKPLEDGKTVQLDHSVQSFTVAIRLGSGVGCQDLKDLIQKKWEVVNLSENDRTDYVS